MTLLITAIPNLGGFVAGGIVMWIVLLAMYFTPTIIAVLRKHRQTGPIAAVNILLGWTVIGWIGAFIWSLMSPPAPAVIIQQAAPAPVLPPAA